jgi:3-hydroxyisobutyrate dehydrogenase
MSDHVVGFVGLGHIGAPMAERVAAMFPIAAYDVRHDAVISPKSSRVADLATVARTADVVLVSVPDGQASGSVISGLAGVEPRRVTTIVDLSTIGPTAAAACARAAARDGLRYVDAPVSGGRRAAIAGRLSIMMAGAATDLQVIKPIVRCFAAESFVVGEQAGLAQAMKLVNNAIALAVVPVTSEALAFGERHGLEMVSMLEVINASSGRTQRSEGMFPTSIVTGTYDHGAVGEITRKDMALFVEEAERTGYRPRIADVVAQMYADFVRAHPATDYSYLHAFVAGSRASDDTRRPMPHGGPEDHTRSGE